ncbi:hypothetical protein CEN50_09835 [Fischerella thermalis CCMEE 5268]|uniref:DUF6884 domain-containing protein n=1 Tax=Fischerella thermalis CCMEE 5268 TaxID=2019662 RepID=A0A2N6KHG0_9CYAN|nr:DUF6884 domain-containing protein [Fischerella thermalis]PLZ98803.1 hypothetical protein CEN50_09835 [Fischerella thermalis CCMEE 5268]
MHKSARYLLIISCSQRKLSDHGFLPAIARYDGGHFRVLRKAQRDGYWSNHIDVLILSAKYGLIEGCTPIANYEQRMNKKRACELKSQVKQTLKIYVKKNVYRELYVDLGQNYQLAIEELGELFKDSLVTYAQGRIGKRLKSLKDWLLAKHGG